MSLTLNAAETLQALAGTPTAVTYSVFGDEISGTPATDNFHVLAQGQVPGSAAAIYTTPGSTQTLVKLVVFANTTGSAVTVKLFINGTAAANQMFSTAIPAFGSATLSDEGWKVTDANGAVITTTASATAGDTVSSQFYGRQIWR